MFVCRQVFHDIAYKAKDRRDLLAGIEEFLDEVIVLPPGEWDPDIRIEPPKSLPSSDKRWAPVMCHMWKTISLSVTFLTNTYKNKKSVPYY